MGRREICNCPWRFHQGQRETMRERDMRKVRREKKKEEERRDAQTQKNALASLLLASLLADWSRSQSTREPEKCRPL